MKKKLITFAKLLVSLSIGAVLIALVFRNLSKPVDFFADDLPSAEANYVLKSWSEVDVFGLEDTLCIVYDEDSIEYPILSKFEGKLTDRLLEPGQTFQRPSSIALVKINLWEVIKSAFSRVNYWWILLSVVFVALSNYSRAIRWRDMFNALGYYPRMSNVFNSVLVTYLGNLAFPRLGEVMRCSFMATYEKIPLQKSLGTMITERIIDLICLGIVFLLTITFEYKVFLQFYNENMRNVSQDDETNSSLKIIIGVVLLVGAFVFWFLLKTNRLPFAEKAKNMMRGLMDGVKSISKLKSKWSYLMHTIIVWGMYWGMNVATLLALPDTASVAFSAALPCLLFGGIAMTLVQGGIGIYPLFISQVLVLYNVSKPIGYAYGWVAWSVQTTLVVVFGLLALFLLNYLNRKRLKID